MRRREASWNSFTSSSGNWTVVHQTVEPSCCTIYLEPERFWEMGPCWCPDRQHPFNAIMTKNTTEVLWDATAASESHHQGIRHLGSLQTVCRLLLQARGWKLLRPNRIQQSNPTPISNVSICTQIWWLNRMKFFPSLITLCALLRNGAQPSSSYTSEGSGLISTHSLHATHWQGHGRTLLKRFKALLRLPNYYCSVTHPMELPLHSADLLSLSLYLSQGKQNRAQGSL